jgi:hypothetical protein
MTPVKGSRPEILLFARSSAEQSSAANMLWSVFGLRFYDVGQGIVCTCRLAFGLRRDGGSSTQNLHLERVFGSVRSTRMLLTTSAQRGSDTFTVYRGDRTLEGYSMLVVRNDSFFRCATKPRSRLRFSSSL